VNIRVSEHGLDYQCTKSSVPCAFVLMLLAFVVFRRIEEFPSPPTCGPCKDSLFRECADVTPVPPDIPGLEPFSPVKDNMIVGKKYCHERNYYNPAKYDGF